MAINPTIDAATASGSAPTAANRSCADCGKNGLCPTDVLKTHCQNLDQVEQYIFGSPAIFQYRANPPKGGAPVPLPLQKFVQSDGMIEVPMPCQGYSFTAKSAPFFKEDKENPQMSKWVRPFFVNGQQLPFVGRDSILDHSIANETNRVIRQTFNLPKDVNAIVRVEHGRPDQYRYELAKDARFPMDEQTRSRLARIASYLNAPVQS